MEICCLQADFFLKKWKWEVVERLKIGDLPTSVRASIDIMNFGRSSDFDTSGNIWTVIEGSLESKKPPPCKVLHISDPSRVSFGFGVIDLPQRYSVTALQIHYIDVEQ